MTRPARPLSFGVIFDMDGVLIDSADAHWESWKRLGEENGLSITREQFASTFGRQSRDIIQGLFGEKSSAATRELSERKELIYRDIIGANPPIVEGAAELVRSLRAAGAALAIGSSGPRNNIDLVLRAIGVADDFAAIVSADDVTRGKPDPQVFELSARRLGLSPAQCIVIEDAPVGIQAAKAAGALAVAVLIYHPRSAFQAADDAVERLSELSVARLQALASASSSG